MEITGLFLFGAQSLGAWWARGRGMNWDKLVTHTYYYIITYFSITPWHARNGAKQISHNVMNLNNN